jgi:peptide/nickel transport system ATP-binding protein/oligopeptide transport system ATP-binding protein
MVKDICRAERPALRPAGVPAGGSADSNSEGTRNGAPVHDVPVAVLPGGVPRPARTAACHFSEEINNA